MDPNDVRNRGDADKAKPVQIPKLAKVRANANIAEIVAGTRLHLARGEIGDIHADRVKALGPLVTAV